LGQKLELVSVLNKNKKERDLEIITFWPIKKKEKLRLIVKPMSGLRKRYNEVVAQVIKLYGGPFKKLVHP